MKTRVAVAAPTKEDLIAAENTYRLDKAMNALAEKDAALYRTLFAAQAKGDWAKADASIAKLSDRRLMGHVLADRFERRGANLAELTDWLKTYPTLPDADDIYAKTQKAGGKNLPRPQAPETWSGGSEIDPAANFTPELMVGSTAPESAANTIARSIQKALRKNDPWTARNLLIAAQNEKKLVGTFAADAEAVIAAAFFYVGEREQATALSGAAAGANQPLGLWIRGLIAWEKADTATARAMFARLADHPALTDSNKAAAHYWAYRAEAKTGDSKQARRYLEQAASVPRSFYGLLAAQKLGRNPIESIAQNDNQPRWNAGHRDLLAANQAGWRALALIQAGQPQRAEAELRRLNPQGDADKQQAMLALASFVPMPALGLQLANLTNGREIDPSLYPLPPWQPAEGFQIDRALLFALARHESLFDPTAVSARGARGLLQIMPTTALAVAAQAGQDEGFAKEKLFDPSVNMSLGQKYVRHLAEMPQIGNNILLLLASYNGGPSKVLNWAADKEKTDPLLFLESIPVRETRNYIARVLPHYWAYRAKLGKPVTTLAQMAQGQWPTAPLYEDTPVKVAAVLRN